MDPNVEARREVLVAGVGDGGDGDGDGNEECAEQCYFHFIGGRDSYLTFRRPFGVSEIERASRRARCLEPK